MNDVVIAAEQLSKQYRLGVIGSGTVREDLDRLWARLRGQPEPTLRIGQSASDVSGTKIWALKDATFEVHQGEILGIIGRNGAGKSTLLKIMSRITSPTSGQVKLRGRIASLLEVGTGFHPELTGRENVYLNGALLGMQRREIDRKFDEIADFSGVEQFLDTPVKRYSSGMYVRLAFAVAAHLEPEILVVDEVLAVGDTAFQKKCLGKMGDISRQGRTVLVVSHAMASIQQLCTSCIWLDQGEIRQIGPTTRVVSAYLSAYEKYGDSVEAEFPEQPEKPAQLRSARLHDRGGSTTQQFECDEPVYLEFVFQVNKYLPGMYGYLSIDKPDGTTVMVSDSYDTVPNPLDNLAEGKYRVRVMVPARTLGPGDYRVYLNFTSTRANDFQVDGPGIVGGFSLTDHATRRGNNRLGHFSTILKWDATPLLESESESDERVLALHRKFGKGTLIQG